jgi:hypothetical protein
VSLMLRSYVGALDRQTSADAWVRAFFVGLLVVRSLRGMSAPNKKRV